MERRRLSGVHQWVSAGNPLMALCPLFTTKALRNEPLPRYDSTQNCREWLHMSDHCRAIDEVLRRERIGETYYVGSGEEADIATIAGGGDRRDRGA